MVNHLGEYCTYQCTRMLALVLTCVGLSDSDRTVDHKDCRFTLGGLYLYKLGGTAIS